MPVKIAAALLFALGPVAALAPRGLPVWLLALAAVAVWDFARARRWPPLFDMPAMIAAAGLTLWAAFSVAASPSPRAALTAVEIAYVAASTYIVSGWFAGLDATARKWLQMAVAAGLVGGVALFAVEDIYDFPLYRWWNGDKPVDWLSVSNVPKRAAAVLALAVWPLTLYLRGRFRTDEPSRLALLVPSVLPAAAIAAASFATSRSALFGLLAGGGAYAIALAGHGAGLRRVLQFGVVAAFALAIPAGLGLSALSAHSSTEGYFRSTFHRMEIWGHAASRALESPWTGYGIDASRSLPVRDETSRFEPLDKTVVPLHPHNAFLQIWLELGGVGAILAAFLLWRLIGLAGKAPLADAPMLLGYAASALAMASSAYGVWQAWWMCGIAATGLLLALMRQGKQSP